MLCQRSERQSIKQNSRDRSKQWRDRFQKQCRDRITSQRWNLVDQKRQEKLWQLTVQDEWENFKRMHEEALKEEGILDPDLFFEEMDEMHRQQHPTSTPSIPPSTTTPIEQHIYEDYDPEADYIHLHSTPILICVNCQDASLQQEDGTDKLACPKCRFSASEKTFRAIQNAVIQHSQQCPGRIVYAPEPGSDGTSILGVCNTCDTMDVF
ncbi:hypothetical protein BDB00DRAFT_875413 [Zychaea mexicana]|uniref:uncharacterized protein n=1 Tax=Zychaea mexicana TaxID=64656 RepID=UPI0022FDD5E1|nr:uncharacterized protein BDB00DRAFT_875413 [Zychaea mexicana]KAI9490362.1 hypothetical protein BDB00DRAFT_875413 [Zychaea mexicana]